VVPKPFRFRVCSLSLGSQN